MRWIECYRCVFDGVMVLWFFRPLAARWGEPGRKRALLGALLLLCALPIYIVPGVNSVWDVLVRFGGRALIYYAWLRVYKGTGVRESLYFALLCWFAFTTENNIFLTPQLTFLRWNMVEFTSAAWLNSVISKVIELLLEVALVTIISRAFPFQDERPIDWQRLGFLGAVVICQLYIKHTLKVISAAAAPLESYGREITSYPILLQLWLAASVLLLERYLAAGPGPSGPAWRRRRNGTAMRASGQRPRPPPTCASSTTT